MPTWRALAFARTFRGNVIMTSHLDAALRYAQRGLPVFPLWPVLPFKPAGMVCGCGTLRCTSPGKHPMPRLAPRGFKDASTDAKVIKEWWTSRSDANIGIATGRGVVVVDVDPRHGGDRSLVELERTNGQLPPTWRVKTGGGGLHIYFTSPPDVMIKNSASQIADGVDVRGHGGYVVAPPSTHISGGFYEWATGKDLAPMPAWLIGALQQPRTKVTAPADWRNLVRGGVTEGKRNDAAARLAGHLLRRYVDPHVTLELLMAWNVTRCAPPLAAPEIATIVNSIAKRELARRQAQ
jgi:hypothetical protein